MEHECRVHLSKAYLLIYVNLPYFTSTSCLLANTRMGTPSKASLVIIFSTKDRKKAGLASSGSCTNAWHRLSGQRDEARSSFLHYSFIWYNLSGLFCSHCTHQKLFWTRRASPHQWSQWHRSPREIQHSTARRTQILVSIHQDHSFLFLILFSFGTVLVHVEINQLEPAVCEPGENGGTQQVLFCLQAWPTHQVEKLTCVPTKLIPMAQPQIWVGNCCL